MIVMKPIIFLLDDELTNDWQKAINNDAQNYTWYFYNYPSENGFDQKTVKDIINEVFRNIEQNLPVFVFMDYQLASNLDNTPLQNECLRNYTMNAISDKGNVYLFLYSSVEPTALSGFYDEVKRKKEEQNWACHLYHMPITLYINKDPYNLGSFLSNQLECDIQRINENDFSNWR